MRHLAAVLLFAFVFCLKWNANVKTAAMLVGAAVLTALIYSEKERE